MPKLRLPSRIHRGGPLLAAGITAALIAVPGLAQAATSPFPPGQIPVPAACQAQIAGDLTQLLADFSTLPTTLPTGLPSNLTDILTQLQSAGLNPDQFLAALQALAAIGSGTPIPLDTSTLSGAEDPSTLTADNQTDDSTSQAGTGTVEPNDSTSADTPDATLPTPPPGLAAVADDLKQLAADLQACAQTASTPSSTAPASSSAAPVSQAAQQQPQAQTQAVSTPQATQPVTYPAYAATGGIAPAALRPASDQRSATVPLSALGGFLLVGSAAVVALRSRARRSGR